MPLCLNSFVCSICRDLEQVPGEPGEFPLCKLFKVQIQIMQSLAGKLFLLYFYDFCGISYIEDLLVTLGCRSGIAVDGWFLGISEVSDGIPPRDLRELV